MKKFLVFILFMSLFFLVSCGSGETDTEELSDIPDWDYSNAVSDDEAENPADPTDNGSDPADPTEDPVDPQPTDPGISDEIPDNENPLPEGCGNETVEYGERCDSAAPITCSNLNSAMTGATKCLPDCTAFDMSTCDKKAWGVLNVRFMTKFILDNAKTGDSNYFSQGALPYAAFNGLYGDSVRFFPQSGDGSVSFAVTDNYTGTFGANKRQLFVKQNPANGYPRHELEFAPGTIKSGAEYKINAVKILSKQFEYCQEIMELVEISLDD